MNARASNRRLQKSRTPDFIRLFWYANEVSKLIGRRKALRLLEEYAISKRLTWFKENRENIKSVKGSPVERAFNIFYKMNQGLSVKDAKITRKSDKIIISRWFNYCPVLEACKITGLDTREICKKVYDRPNQVFLSKIHPKLIFRRNYKAIRPHACYCEEIITLKVDEKK
jgi:hypothetical protein